MTRTGNRNRENLVADKAGLCRAQTFGYSNNRGVHIKLGCLGGGGVEMVGFILIAMEHIVPPRANAMFIGHVRAPTDDGVPVILARDVVDVDALSDGPVPLVLSEELR